MCSNRRLLAGICVPVLLLLLFAGCTQQPFLVSSTVEVTREVPIEVTRVVEVTVEPPDPYAVVAAHMEDSLHGTTRGMGYFYAADQGGMELLSGVPYAALPCKNCHTRYNSGDKAAPIRCAGCHIADPEGLAPPQFPVLLPQHADGGGSGCLNCHRRQGFEFTRTTVRLDPEGNPVSDPLTGVAMQVPLLTDVHRSTPPNGKALQCTNCHGTGDTHGDGTVYNSLLESPNTRCTDCHQTELLSDHRGHTVHADNMTCESCHMQTVVTCYGCHINTVMNGIPEFPYEQVIGWKFLIRNEEGKYDVGNLMTAVYTTDEGEVKTFAVIAPYYGHTVTDFADNPNAACDQCHQNANVRAYEGTGTITVSAWDETTGSLQYPARASVVVPVPQDYETALQLAFPYVTNIEDVAAGGAQSGPEARPLATFALGKDSVDLWQMLYAQPIEEMPPQMQFDIARDSGQ